MDFLRKHSTKLLIGTGVATVLVGVYLVFRNNDKSQSKASKAKVKNSESRKKKRRKSSVDIESETEEFYSNLTRSRVNLAIKVQREQDRISIKSLFEMYEAMVEFSKDDFILLVLSNRRERRKVINDTAVYIKTWKIFNEKIETILQKAQQEVTSILGVTEAEFESSVAKYMKEGSQELFYIYSTLPRRMKMSLVSKKVVNKQEFKQILKAQANFLKKEHFSLQDMLLQAPPDERSLAIIQNRLDDFTYETFQVEEEDLTEALKRDQAGITKDEEVIKLQKEITEALHSILPKNLKKPVPVAGFKGLSNSVMF